jgi:uncharacterized protein YjbI with pentapeptide repeats
MTSVPNQLRKKYIEHAKQVPCFSLFKLSLAALPTVVFGIFTIVFTLQQDASARATRQQDQQQADETNNRIIFKEYINGIKELLLDEHFQENMNKSLLLARVQTLTVLRHLDGHRKRDVILFLYENGLLRHDRPPNVDLRGANLIGMKFIQSSTEACDLKYLYLPGVYAENIVFDGCLLDEAVFEHASLVGARFGDCSLMQSNFANANLTRAQLRANLLYRANFTGASLVESSLETGVFQQVDLTNSDLYRSQASDQLLNPMAHGGVSPNIFVNTRFPNGSFSEINTKNLVTHGQAQSLVQYLLVNNLALYLLFCSAICIQRCPGLPSEKKVLIFIEF